MQVVRYLATVAPLGKTDPAVWSSAFNDGSFSTEDATWTLLALIAFVGITVVSIGFPMGVPHERSRTATCRA